MCCPLSPAGDRLFLTTVLEADVVVGLACTLRVRLHASLIVLTAELAGVRLRRGGNGQPAEQQQRHGGGSHDRTPLGGAAPPIDYDTHSGLHRRNSGQSLMALPRR